MRRHLFIFLCICCFLTPLFCRGQEMACPLLFDETTFDFGTADEDGGRISHVYSFRNASRDTVFIAGIRTLCRCTVGEASPRVILPGEKGSIKVTFDPYGYAGEQYKGVTVVTDPKSEYKLTFSVNIIPRKKTVEERYPVAAVSGLRLEKTDFNFLQLSAGQSKSLSLRFANVSGNELHLVAEIPSSGGMFSVECPASVAPYSEGEIVMTYAASGHSVGFHYDSFFLSVFSGDSTGRIPIEAAVAVTDDFSGLEDSSPRPSMRMGGTYVNAGAIGLSDGVRRISYTMRNEGNAPLTIRDISCPDGLSATIGPGVSVAPGGFLHFDVILDAGHFPEGSLFKTVRILSDDPSSPVKDLMIAARIVK